MDAMEKHSSRVSDASEWEEDAEDAHMTEYLGQGGIWDEPEWET
jgi:hypothetical protein